VDRDAMKFSDALRSGRRKIRELACARLRVNAEKRPEGKQEVFSAKITTQANQSNPPTVFI
jgi:hypothetical protein